MAERPPPQIFSRARCRAVHNRSEALRAGTREQPFLYEHMTAEIIERLSFVRHRPSLSLVSGPAAHSLKAYLAREGGEVAADEGIDPEAPYPVPSGRDGFDFIASLAALDTVNDLPGALIHMHRALARGGLAIATFVGAPSLASLRRAMLAADGERPAARMHPLIDVRAAAELIQRAGWRSPVVDSHALRVSYPSLDRLVADLRLHGMTARLASPAPALSRFGMERAREAFMEGADDDKKVIEEFEIITLSGWR